MKKKIIGIIKYLPVVLLIIHCVIIFGFSAQSAAESTETSTKAVEQVLDVINGDAEVTKEDVKKAEPHARNTAHFVLFLVLGVLCMLAFRDVKGCYRFIFVLAFCILYALTDEIHQSFSPGRSFEFQDICTDFAGSICGALLYYVFEKIWRRKR